jgi:MFS family permease
VTDRATSRRNILLLAISQALYSSCVIIVFTTAALAGLMLAPDKALATLPVTTFVAGSALATIPISMLMQRFGRLPVFVAGALFSAAGAALSVMAIFQGSFWLFCVGTALQGIFQSTSGFYRFAAAEGAVPELKPQAISWVLTGGVVAAVVGTVLASRTAEAFAPFTFAGSYVAVSVMALVAIGILLLLRLPKPTVEEVSGQRRPWSELLKEPRLIVAMASAVIAYGLMNFMMTAAPVAMVGCGFTPGDASWVIQWHVLAMFVPSFFTGNLIKRFSAEKVTAAGMVLLMIAAVIALMGIRFEHFSFALILLGLGWNFGFIGGTAMLTDSYKPAERGKVQGMNDFLIAAVMVVASFSSGKILAGPGWEAIAWIVLPVAFLSLTLVLWRTRTPARE